jgi:hypothetical protein
MAATRTKGVRKLSSIGISIVQQMAKQLKTRENVTSVVGEVGVETVSVVNILCQR